MKNLSIKTLASFALLASTLSTLTACGGQQLPIQQTRFGMQQAPRFFGQNARFGRFNEGALGGKKWTMAVHMAADNNLYTAGLDDINEMEAGLASDDVNLIVLFDGSPKGDSKIYQITRDPNGYDRKIISKVIDDKGAVIPASKEIDSGDPAVFNKFVDFVTKNFAAENNGMVIWNHGSGIYRQRRGISANNYPLNGSQFEMIPGAQQTQPASNKSFASDDNGGEMHLRHLNPALALAAQNLGKPMDILGFDTCLMGYMETAYQIKDQASFLVASEELEPGDGWDYHGWAAKLSANPGMSPAELSSVIVDTYGASYRPGGSQRGTDVTLSALDVNLVASQLAPAMSALGNELLASLPSQKPALDAARQSTQTFYNSDSADLGHFLALLNAAPSGRSRITPAVAQVSQALKAAVVRETHYGTGVANATGAQVYFPKAYMSYNKRYDDAKDIRYAEQPQWGSFLKKYTAK